MRCTLGLYIRPPGVNIYVHHMALEAAEQTDLDMYANDSTLGVTGETIDLVVQKLGSDIGNIVN